MTSKTLGNGPAQQLQQFAEHKTQVSAKDPQEIWGEIQAPLDAFISKQQGQEYSPDATRIIVLGTGGTFQSKQGGSGYEPTGSLEESLSALQLPNDKRISLNPFDIMNIDSSQMIAGHWEVLCKVAAYIEQKISMFYDAIIVTHGTDTMTLGAAYAAFRLRGLPKPLIFLGSQYPAMQEDSDAREHCDHALDTARLAVKNGVAECMIACGMHTIRAVHAIKMTDTGLNVFDVANHQAFSLGHQHGLPEATMNNGRLLSFDGRAPKAQLKFPPGVITADTRSAFDPFLEPISYSVPPQSITATGMSPVQLSNIITQSHVTCLKLLGSGTAWEPLVQVVREAVGLGYLVVPMAPFSDSIASSGSRYAAGNDIYNTIPRLQRPLPIICMTPDAMSAKISIILQQMEGRGMVAEDGIFKANEQRFFYEQLASNWVNEHLMPTNH